VEDQHLISVDELRAAGALDVPAAWRKSLAVERALFFDFIDDDEAVLDEPEPTPLDTAGTANERASGDGQETQRS